MERTEVKFENLATRVFDKNEITFEISIYEEKRKPVSKNFIEYTFTYKYNINALISCMVSLRPHETFSFV